MGRRKKLFDYEDSGIRFGMRAPRAQQENDSSETVSENIQHASRASFSSIREAEKSEEKRKARLDDRKKQGSGVRIGINNWSRDLSRSSDKDERLSMYLHELETSKSSSHRNVFSALSKKDSREYTNVKNGLEAVISVTSSSFTNNPEVNGKILKEASGTYRKLLDACEEYLAKSGGTTTLGVARKNKVREIMSLAEDDYYGIHQQYINLKNVPADQQTKLDWQEILFSSREAILEVKDLEDEQSFKRLGENAKEGDARSYLMRDKRGVFTKEKILDANGWGDMRDVIGPAFNKSAKDDSPNIFLGNKQNITSRNVATSRMAALVGLSDLVAESKTVKIKDRKNDKVYRGNMMELATGNLGKAERETMAKKLNANQIDSKLETRREAVLEKVAPSVQKELCSLQVFDYLCGQGDRHDGNFFLEKNEKEQWAHVKGIDNDNAFGSGVDFQKFVEENARGTKMRGVLGKSKDGKEMLTIPYIDKQLAKNILNLKEEEVIFALEDLLTPGIIELTLQRLRKLKNAIFNSMNSESEKDRFVENWEDGTSLNRARAMLEQNLYMKELKKGKKIMFSWDIDDTKWEGHHNSTYFGEFVQDAMGYNEYADQWIQELETDEK